MRLSDKEAVILAQAKEIRARQQRVKRAAKLAAIAESCGQTDIEWPRGKYAVIYADPAWKHDIWGEAGKDRAAENHYPVMETEEIAALPVPAIVHDDAVLFLWTTTTHLGDALDIMRHRWGFDYVTNLIWNKDKAGLGKWSRNKHEQLLIGRRGNVPGPLHGDGQLDSVIDAPRGEHSAKPEEFRQMISRFFPDLPKIELFCRGEPAPGWDAWGNEVQE